MSLSERLSRLGTFADEFGAAGFSMGKWSDFGFGYSEPAHRFMQYCQADGWVDPGYDWPAWVESDASQPFRDPDFVRSSADADDLKRLLTVAIRQDRFNEGGLAGWHEDGLLLAIMHRAKALSGA